MPTSLQLATFSASAWVPRAGGAVMSVLVTVEGDPDRLCPDLARELSTRLDWCVFGESCIAVDAYPTGQLGEGEAPAGALLIALDPNQSGAEWGDGDTVPGVSPVRLILTQVLTREWGDVDTMIDRRADVRRVIHELTGRIGYPPPPRAPRPPPIPVGTWFFRWLDIADAPARPRLDADLDALMNPLWIMGGSPESTRRTLSTTSAPSLSGWPAFLLPTSWLPAQIAAVGYVFPPWRPKWRRSRSEASATRRSDTTRVSTGSS